MFFFSIFVRWVFWQKNLLDFLQVLVKILYSFFSELNIFPYSISLHYYYARCNSIKQLWPTIHFTTVTRWLYCAEWTQYSIRLEAVRYIKQVFPWAHQSPRLKRHLDRFSHFCWLTRWQTDWQIDRPRYSVGNNRRSAQWRSQILLLSTATTGIYYSSQLDRWDQLQQSAVIFSCKTRRVGDTLQYSLEESVSHRRTRQVTQLFTYLLTHMLFSSCIQRYLVSRACDWVMPSLSAVLHTFSFQFNLFFFHVGSQETAVSYVI